MYENEKSSVETMLEKGFNKFGGLSVKIKSGILLGIFIVAFTLGIFAHKGVAIKQSEMDALNSEKEKVSAELTEKTNEFNDYREKMQPYEETQKADEKARIEAEKLAKKEAEEKAAAEAAEKAAAEAEEKRKEEDALKTETFYMSTSDFISKFNVNMELLGSSIIALRPSNQSDDFIDVKTSVDHISFSFILKSGYILGVYVNGRGTGTSQSAIDQIYSMVAAAQALDASLEKSEISNFLIDIINEAQNSSSATSSGTKNGNKYTVSTENGMTALLIKKG